MSKVIRITRDQAQVSIANYYLVCLMMFVALTAKALDLFLLPTYRFKPCMSFLTVFIKKLNVYPLCFERSYGVSGSKIALKYLFFDMVKLLKQLGIVVEGDKVVFNGFSNVCYLINLIFRNCVC